MSQCHTNEHNDSTEIVEVDEDDEMGFLVSEECLDEDELLDELEP
jgi:hypothetical protein